MPQMTRLRGFQLHFARYLQNQYLKSLFNPGRFFQHVTSLVYSLPSLLTSLVIDMHDRGDINNTLCKRGPDYHLCPHLLTKARLPLLRHLRFGGANICPMLFDLGYANSEQTCRLETIIIDFNSWNDGVCFSDSAISGVHQHWDQMTRAAKDCRGDFSMIRLFYLIKSDTLSGNSNVYNFPEDENLPVSRMKKETRWVIE